MEIYIPSTPTVAGDEIDLSGIEDAELRTRVRAIPEIHKPIWAVQIGEIVAISVGKWI